MTTSALSRTDCRFGRSGLTRAGGSSTSSSSSTVAALLLSFFDLVIDEPPERLKIPLKASVAGVDSVLASLAEPSPSDSLSSDCGPAFALARMAFLSSFLRSLDSAA